MSVKSFNKHLLRSLGCGHCEQNRPKWLPLWKLALISQAFCCQRRYFFSFVRTKPNGQMAMMSHIGNPISILQILMNVDYKKKWTSHERITEKQIYLFYYWKISPYSPNNKPMSLWHAQGSKFPCWLPVLLLKKNQHSSVFVFSNGCLKHFIHLWSSFPFLEKERQTPCMG